MNIPIRAQLKAWQSYFPNKCMWPQWKTVDTTHGYSSPPGFSHSHYKRAMWEPAIPANTRKMLSPSLSIWSPFLPLDAPLFLSLWNILMYMVHCSIVLFSYSFPVFFWHTPRYEEPGNEAKNTCEYCMDLPLQIRIS